VSQIEIGADVAGNSGATSIYAGFWRRFWAYLLDALVLFVISGLAYSLIFIVSFGVLHRYNGISPLYIDNMYYGDMIGHVFGFVLPWLYYALMESSSKQATLGKMAFEIYVTDMEGKKISFARATARYFCMIFISGITLGIGYVMAGLTAKRQALHDKIAECLVLRRI
jgi:uncharacterized RDD family membrane protein YckC